MKKPFLILIIIVVVFSYFWYLTKDKYKNSQDPSRIVSFEKCVEAGNPVAESFPEQCRTEDGVLFVNWQRAGQFCIQVITPARNPQTGEIREFPTPCDVPEGWIPL
ncbi:MAG: hypothetical protein HY505_01970 [Candidatus Yanofskybacteria bacterium]|nr:hypothetical protein [Candidatus Yanofskybacteria bacterium]